MLKDLRDLQCGTQGMMTPEMRAMLSNPAMLQMMTNPASMQAAMNMMGGGAGGAFGMPPQAQSPSSTPAGAAPEVNPLLASYLSAMQSRTQQQPQQQRTTLFFYLLLLV